jgi:hypothetical protein
MGTQADKIKSFQLLLLTALTIIPTITHALKEMMIHQPQNNEIENQSNCVSSSTI